jgi:hypothetical protein
MYKLSMLHNGNEIQNILIDKGEISGLRTVIDLFESKFGLDISNYHLSQIKLEYDVLKVFINDEDFITWRSKRIDSLIEPDPNRL